MNKIWVFVWVTAMLCACSGGTNKVKIKGEFKKLRDGEFYVFSEQGAIVSYDTVRIEDGAFSYEKELDHPAILTLQYPNFTQMHVIAIPGRTIKISGTATNLAKTEITGTEDNELLTSFRLETIGLSTSKLLEAAEKFIRQHPSSLASQVVFDTYFIDQNPLSGQKVEELLSLLIKHQPQNSDLLRLKATLGSLPKVAPGQIIPACVVRDIDGRERSLRDFKDKYLLINFWAQWNSKSYLYLLEVNRVVKNHASRIAVVNISLDADPKGCKKTIQKDSIAGTNVCDGLMWESPFVRQLGVRYVPGNILVDTHGKILARDLDKDAMVKKLNDIIK